MHNHSHNAFSFKTSTLGSFYDKNDVTSKNSFNIYAPEELDEVSASATTVPVLNLMDTKLSPGVFKALAANQRVSELYLAVDSLERIDMETLLIHSPYLKKLLVVGLFDNFSIDEIDNEVCEIMKRTKAARIYANNELSESSAIVRTSQFEGDGENEDAIDMEYVNYIQHSSRYDAEDLQNLLDLLSKSKVEVCVRDFAGPASVLFYVTSNNANMMIEGDIEILGPVTLDLCAFFVDRLKLKRWTTPLHVDIDSEILTRCIYGQLQRKPSQYKIPQEPNIAAVFSRLEELSLLGNNDNNPSINLEKTDPIQHQLLEFVLKATNLKKLTMQHSSITDITLKTLFENCATVELNIFNNTYSLPSAIQYLANNNSLLHLDLSNSDLEGADFQVFREALSLCKVTFDGCGINSLQFSLFACSKHHIIELSVKNNKIDDKGAQSFTNDTTVERLDLSGNEITDVGAIALANNNTLKHLNLTSNELTTNGLEPYLSKTPKILSFDITQCLEYALLEDNENNVTTTVQILEFIVSSKDIIDYNLDEATMSMQEFLETRLNPTQLQRNICNAFQNLRASILKNGSFATKRGGDTVIVQTLDPTTIECLSNNTMDKECKSEEAVSPKEKQNKNKKACCNIF
jgi:hypothetical protein